MPRQAALNGSASPSVEAVAAGVIFSPLSVRENATAVVTTPRCRATSTPAGEASHAVGYSQKPGAGTPR